MEERQFDPKLLGILAMVGSPMMLIEFLLENTVGLPGGPLGKFEGVLGIIYLFGFLCSALGLRLVRATGTSNAATALLGVQIVGLSLAACQNILQITGLANKDSRFFQIANVAWPFSHIFMIAIAVAVLSARVWSDWRRFTPLWCGLALPLAMAAGAIGGARRPRSNIRCAHHYRIYAPRLRDTNVVSAT